jgi:hypothetical protein
MDRHVENNSRFLQFSERAYKQSSATRSECLMQPHYAYSQVTSRGRRRILPFYLTKGRESTVEENGLTFFLTKDRLLTVDESGYAPDKHNFISKQSFLLTNLATYFGFLVKPSSG